jgi:hypothetical protein
MSGERQSPQETKFLIYVLKYILEYGMIKCCGCSSFNEVEPAKYVDFEDRSPYCSYCYTKLYNWQCRTVVDLTSFKIADLECCRSWN